MAPDINHDQFFDQWNYGDYSAIHGKIVEVAKLFRTVSAADDKELNHFAATVMSNIWPYLRNPKDDEISPRAMLNRSPLSMTRPADAAKF